MGFVPTVRIVKTRRTGRWGEVSLCLDAVDGLGTFVELETLTCGERPGGEVQEDLDRLVRSLGVPVRRSGDTYDSLLRAAAAAG